MAVTVFQNTYPNTFGACLQAVKDLYAWLDVPTILDDHTLAWWEERIPWFLNGYDGGYAGRLKTNKEMHDLLVFQRESGAWHVGVYVGADIVVHLYLYRLVRTPLTRLNESLKGVFDVRVKP